MANFARFYRSRSANASSTALALIWELDKLYAGVLQRAASKNPRSEHAERIQCVIATIICLRNPLSLSNLATFLSATLEDIRNTLHFQHSVVIVPDDAEEPVRFFHQSFPDFIRDEARFTDKRFLDKCIRA